MWNVYQNQQTEHEKKYQELFVTVTGGGAIVLDEISARYVTS